MTRRRLIWLWIRLWWLRWFRPRVYQTVMTAANVRQAVLLEHGPKGVYADWSIEACIDRELTFKRGERRGRA
jgi:hypothetical protein